MENNPLKKLIQKAAAVAGMTGAGIAAVGETPKPVELNQREQARIISSAPHGTIKETFKLGEPVMVPKQAINSEELIGGVKPMGPTIEAVPKPEGYHVQQAKVETPAIDSSQRKSPEVYPKDTPKIAIPRNAEEAQTNAKTEGGK